jgi:hypothetical protein
MNNFQKIILTSVLMLWGISIASAQNKAATSLVFTGDTISIMGSGATATDSNALITAAGTYTLRGTLNDGQVVVDDEHKGAITLILDGVTLHSSTSAPIYIKEAGSVEIILADGTQNTLTDATTYVYATREDEEPNAALFSDDPLTLSGDGSLSVTARFNDGITSKDSLLITGNPIISVTATDDGIHGKDWLTIDGGNITISAGGDGLKSDTTITLNAGTVNIPTSYEGVEAEYITINGGEIRLVSSDDGFNATSQADTVTTTAQTGGRAGRGGGFGESAGAYLVTINGGMVVMDAQGDGLDSNGSIVMTGGTVIVNGTTANNNGSVDYNGGFTISGGLLIAVGSAGMPQAPEASSTQNSVMLNSDTIYAGGTLVHIQNSAGENIMTFAPNKNFQSVVLSSAGLVSGETYTVYVGGSATGEVTDGLYSDNPTTLGTQIAQFTVSSTVTQVGQARGMRR